METKHRLSFNKKEGDFDKIDQQHLSNCWWFIKVFGEDSEKEKYTLEVIKRQLIDRFNGQLMPYQPHIANKEEIKLLEERGMLSQDHAEHNSFYIMFEEKQIGRIRLIF